MRITTLLAALALSAGAPPPAQAQHEHAAAAAAAAQATGQRWSTDAPLRAGMAAIRESVGDLKHHEMGHMSPDQAKQAATDIEHRVHDIVATCKLAPEADAALHRIIAPLLENAAALKADPGRLDAIPPMREALAEYARQFDDAEFASP